MDGFELFQQGAEGRLYKGTYLGKPAIAKERFVKKYRHPDLDSVITKERIRSESRAIIRCKIAGIKTPTLYLVDFTRRIIYMEYFEHSIQLKTYIESSEASKDNLETLSLTIGALLGKMHKNNIIHGDLTSSNILLLNKKRVHEFFKIEDLEAVFIDFGLSHVESSAEDKGVDLYVLERALISTHAAAKDVFDKILEGYRKGNSGGAREVLAKFEEVRARGRKRTMIG